MRVTCTSRKTVKVFRIELTAPLVLLLSLLLLVSMARLIQTVSSTSEQPTIEQIVNQLNSKLGA